MYKEYVAYYEQTRIGSNNTEYVTENKTEEAFDELLNVAEGLMKSLGLHYQVSKLAAGDCAQGMCRTYDIEVWLPSYNAYKEISSCSNI